jgi:protoporphyrin/coproporphyrin ferrochelatase
MGGPSSPGGRGAESEGVGRAAGIAGGARVRETFDALLLLSFGGPEAPQEIIPFLENVTRGRGIPRERLAEVGEHYFRMGGRSPINDQCRKLLAAIRGDFAANDLDLPVYWGNRNWHPMLADTVRQMMADGVTRALVFVTAAYSSYSSCRQYREDMAAALTTVGPGGPELVRLRHYFNHPGFVEPFVDTTVAALGEVPRGSRLVFTTHSIPEAWAATSGPTGWAYVDQHRETAKLVAAGVAERTGPTPGWDLVYQSRSGPPSQPWLEPDVVDHLKRLSGTGVPGAVLVPIGFVSDHMEVLYDLDVEAAEAAAKLGLPLARAATPGTDPRFTGMIRELVLERMTGTPPAQRVALGALGPAHDRCPTGCCPNPRGPRPAVSGAD